MVFDIAVRHFSVYVTLFEVAGFFPTFLLALLSINEFVSNDSTLFCWYGNTSLLKCYSKCCKLPKSPEAMLSHTMFYQCIFQESHMFSRNMRSQ